MTGDRTRTADRLRERGLRPTKARLRILRELVGRQDHPSAEALLESLRGSGEPLSTATLYQNLNAMADAGLIRRFSGAEGVMRFEANLDPHHHLVCARCGRVLDAFVDEEQLRRLQPVDVVTGEPIAGWELQTVQLEVQGLCPVCRGES